MIHTTENPGEYPDKIKSHVPVLTITDDQVTVRVGETPHPMSEEHLITMIELYLDGEVIAQKMLTPVDQPEAVFAREGDGKYKARAICNLHGTWES